DEDGRYPSSGLIQASDGMLYGTTRIGGRSGNGTVFALSPAGNRYRVLRHFAYEASLPEGPLLETKDGWLYGMTSLGAPLGFGTVFRIRKDGTGFALVHTFDAGDGFQPAGGLIEGSDGALYGATGWGGTNGEGI